MTVGQTFRYRLLVSHKGSTVPNCSGGRGKTTFIINVAQYEHHGVVQNLHHCINLTPIFLQGITLKILNIWGMPYKAWSVFIQAAYNRSVTVCQVQMVDNATVCFDQIPIGAGLQPLIGSEVSLILYSCSFINSNKQVRSQGEWGEAQGAGPPPPPPPPVVFV